MAYGPCEQHNKEPATTSKQRTTDRRRADSMLPTRQMIKPTWVQKPPFRRLQPTSEHISLQKKSRNSTRLFRPQIEPSGWSGKRLSPPPNQHTEADKPRVKFQRVAGQRVHRHIRSLFRYINACHFKKIRLVRALAKASRVIQE